MQKKPPSTLLRRSFAFLRRAGTYLLGSGAKEAKRRDEQSAERLAQRRKMLWDKIDGRAERRCSQSRGRRREARQKQAERAAGKKRWMMPAAVRQRRRAAAARKIQAAFRAMCRRPQKERRRKAAKIRSQYAIVQAIRQYLRRAELLAAVEDKIKAEAVLAAAKAELEDAEKAAKKAEKKKSKEDAAEAKAKVEAALEARHVAAAALVRASVICDEFSADARSRKT